MKLLSDFSVSGMKEIKEREGLKSEHMQLKCAIIDDDDVFAEIMRHYIAKIDFLEVVGTYPDPSVAFTELDFNEVDFLFLDVEMPGMTGIEFLNSLPGAPPVIIVSRKKEYGVDAFEFDSIDYLLKPVSFSRFLKAVSKARTFFEQTGKKEKRKNDSLFVRQDRMWIRVPLSDILYIKADNNDVEIRTHEKTYRHHARLSDVLAQLPEKDFLQIHRSYIVRLSKIDKVDGDVIEINTRIIPVSKTYLRDMHERLNLLK